MSRKAVCASALACLLAVPALTVYAKKAKPAIPEPPVVPQMTADQQLLYALNRLAYGPRPGDVETIRKAGLEKWIEWQLQPVPKHPRRTRSSKPKSSRSTLSSSPPTS